MLCDRIPGRVLPVLLLLLGAAGHAASDEPDGYPAGPLPPETTRRLVDPLTIPKDLSFAAGERLQFRLGWSLFTVARAEMTVAPDTHEGRAALRITLTTRTNRFADAFYKVRNTTTSWVAADLSRSFEYSAVQREGSRRRDSVCRFDPETLTAHRLNRLTGEQEEPAKIVPGTFDPLGIVFFVRSIEFTLGDELLIPTSNGRELFYTLVRVVDKVERDFLSGRREAWVLEPDIKDVGGVFSRSENASLRFYISADAARLPLRMESEVSVGSFWAELVDAES